MMRGTVLFVTAFLAVSGTYGVQAAGKKPVTVAPIELVSQNSVHFVDPVSAKAGNIERGTAQCMDVGDDGAVRYFANADNMAAYLQHPEQYPDADASVKLAFMGADVTARFPYGTKSPGIGNVVLGSTDYSVVHKGARFLFANADNQEAFKKDPEKFVLPVGGYCLGAMAEKRAVSGNPWYVWYVQKAKTWAVFGSPNGPERFAKMSADEQYAVFKRAVGNYHSLTNTLPAFAKRTRVSAK